MVITNNATKLLGIYTGGTAARLDINNKNKADDGMSVNKERNHLTMRINNNITALNSHRQLGINTNRISRNVERLSSGFRINRAADDAAGLAISEKMRAQIRGLNQASRNSQDAISLVQTAEGGMQTMQDILQRMREISLQSASDTYTQGLDRNALHAEFNQLRSELDQISTHTEFNTRRILAGDASSLTIQVGANAGQVLTISIGTMNATSLGVTSELTIENQAGASSAVRALDTAINSISMARANLGAMQNRLEFKIQNLDNQAENLQAAESRIRDVDMAREMTSFVRNQILTQAATAMLAQANSLPSGVLQLLT